MQHGFRFAALALAIAVSSNASADSPPIFAPEDIAAQPGHTGSWTVVDRDGHGLILNITGPYDAALTWNTYTPDNAPLWLVGAGRIEANRIVFDLNSATGASFPRDGLPAATPIVSSWGTLTMTFQSCTEATIRWESTAPGYGSGSARLSRLTVPAGLPCEDESSLFTHTSLGAPPVEVSGLAEGKTLVAIGGEVIVGTKDGLWRRKLDGNAEWERAGLAGFEVAFVVEDPSGEGRLFAGGVPRDANEKPLYVSYDAGRTWQNARTAFFDEGRGRHEAFTDIAVWPKDPLVIYASLEGGPGVAVSTNGGRDWKRADGSTGSYIGYPCRIAFVPGEDYKLYQGCEALLDFVRIGYYDLDENALDDLPELRVLAGTSIEGVPDVQNRRPNLILGSESRPGVLYAGLEGALVALPENRGIEYVYESPLSTEPDEYPHPYVYISAIWIDPKNPFHLIFGGGLNGDNEDVQLYETFDHGLRARGIGIEGGTIENPVVDAIVPLDARGDRFVYTVKSSDDLRTRTVPQVFRLDRRRGIGLPTAR